MKSLLSFCHKTGMIPFDVGKALRLPRIPDDLAGKILTVEDVQRVIRMEPTPRNQVLIRVLYISGIRASEAAGLRWVDVQARDEGGQITVTGKGRKTRSIRLPRRSGGHSSPSGRRKPVLIRQCLSLSRASA